MSEIKETLICENERIRVVLKEPATGQKIIDFHSTVSRHRIFSVYDNECPGGFDQIASLPHEALLYLAEKALWINRGQHHVGFQAGQRRGHKEGFTAGLNSVFKGLQKIAKEYQQATGSGVNLYENRTQENKTGTGPDPERAGGADGSSPEPGQQDGKGN